jgi:hypothetical protein
LSFGWRGADGGDPRVGGALAPYRVLEA